MSKPITAAVTAVRAGRNPAKAAGKAGASAAQATRLGAFAQRYMARSGAYAAHVRYGCECVRNAHGDTTLGMNTAGKWYARGKGHTHTFDTKAAALKCYQRLRAGKPAQARKRAHKAAAQPATHNA